MEISGTWRIRPGIRWHPLRARDHVLELAGLRSRIRTLAARSKYYRVRHIGTGDFITFDQAQAIMNLHLPLVPEVLEPFFAANRKALNTDEAA